MNKGVPKPNIKSPPRSKSKSTDKNETSQRERKATTGLERSKKYKYTRLSDESKLALQRPVLQILSNFHRMNAIKKTKAFFRWKQGALILEQEKHMKHDGPEVIVPETAEKGVSIGALDIYFQARNGQRSNEDNSVLLRSVFSSWRYCNFDNYKMKTKKMQSHMFWTALLRLERAVLRRAFLKVRNSSLLDVGIANEMRAYLETALNSDSSQNSPNTFMRSGGESGTTLNSLMTEEEQIQPRRLVTSTSTPRPGTGSLTSQSLPLSMSVTTRVSLNGAPLMLRNESSQRTESVVSGISGVTSSPRGGHARSLMDLDMTPKGLPQMSPISPAAIDDGESQSFFSTFCCGCVAPRPSRDHQYSPPPTYDPRTNFEGSSMNSMASSANNSNSNNVESILNSSLGQATRAVLSYETNHSRGPKNLSFETNHARGLSSRKVQIPLFKPRGPNSNSFKSEKKNKETMNQQYIDSMFGEL
ncbi:hypothetical protein TrST_g8302 [Triparma strigata]|uniref:Uncharacterized protein n=1 Tax=Triparma strigata TaxID=1606541 RepID=A0A9W7F1W1_9STRA|nr:hypothetical protein TrST_g8302 [Triparma strigata]